MAIRRIGFIGLGNMGAPMAANLARAGFELSVYDLREQQAREFAAAHRARFAGSLAALAETSECIITMLPDDQAVKRAVFGGVGDCLAQGLEAGHLLVNMGTSDPNATRALGAALSLRGVHVIDAPVTGCVAFAREATLDVMAGGDAEAIELLAPVFAALGRKVYYCGVLGSAHALEAVNNYVNACSLASLVEGLALGRKLGIDTALMVETMQSMCAGRNHPLDKAVIPHVLTRKHATGMALGYIVKDLRIAVEAAHRVGAVVPLAERVHELWEDAANSLGATLDQTEIVRYWERASGVTL